ncbi:MAG: hypothetical protein HON90_11240, partial [Halobacteriovoraceae bacterium]|nr:hypothetical protein [Halobacteriovoraceae bacterium]
MKWVQTSNHPHADDAFDLATQLSWGELFEITKRGGIEHIEAMTGCIHKCQGCSVRCDLIYKTRKMKWEDYQASLKKLKGLEDAIKSFSNEEAH